MLAIIKRLLPEPVTATDTVVVAEDDPLAVPPPPGTAVV
jgi:hypothetical protein